MTYADTPLNDPDYEPDHPPADGCVPDVVGKWGAASQLRWFRRFWGDLAPHQRTYAALERFYCASTEHPGACCSTCLDEEEHGYHYTDLCCCRALEE